MSKMPKLKLKDLLYPLIVVLITVPCMVFYCSSYEAGGFSLEVVKNSAQFIPLEYALAFVMEVLIGGPLSHKIVQRVLGKSKHDPIVSYTVNIVFNALTMCVVMSFWGVVIYNGILGAGEMALDTYLANFIPFWLEKIVLHYPFVVLMQLLIIQPLSAKIFGLVYRQRAAKREQDEW